jgi:hypothetical protein
VSTVWLVAVGVTAWIVLAALVTRFFYGASERRHHPSIRKENA